MSSLVTPNYLDVLFNSSATGSGGRCRGDSGGPTFLADGSNVVLGVLTWGDTICSSMGHGQRLAVLSVRDWLLQHGYPTT